MAALLGAFIGGGFTTGVALVGERKRDGREQDARDREARQASRMISQELTKVMFDLTWAIDHHTWWQPKHLRFETPAWDQFASALAASSIDFRSWSWITNAYYAITEMNQKTEHAFETNPELPFGRNAQALTVSLRTTVQQGIDYLDAFMEGMPPPEVERTEVTGDFSTIQPVLGLEDPHP